MVNKLIWIPLTVVLLLSIVSMLATEESTYSGSWDPGATGGSMTNETGTYQIDIEGINAESFNFSGIEAGMVILGIAVAAGIIAGVQVFSSGLSPFSQSLIFQGAIYIGIWGVFSGLSYDIINAMAGVGFLLWMILTIVYVVGFSTEISGTAGGV